MLIGTGGNWEKLYSGDCFYLTKHFGPVNLKFVFYRTSVCERVVVGKKTIPSHYTPEHEVEVVEWKCSPILGGDNA